MCYISCFYGKNYGTMLVSYATYKLLEKTGLSILVLNKPDIIWADGHERESENPIAYTFARKYYANISRCHSNVADMAHLNDECQAFVVGSDQLFLPGLRLDSLALLPFARQDKRKIAYATSFGRDEYLAPLERLQQNKALLKRFEYLSLREYPQHLLRNVFELEATEVLEPTLCIPREHYSMLADSATELQLPEEPYLLTYMLDASPEKEEALCHIAQKLNLKVIFVRNIFAPKPRYSGSQLIGERDYSPEQFLKLYRGASFVVTDSFHGTCFAVKFAKPFVSFVNTGRGALRYKLFDNMKLSHRLINKPADIFTSNHWMEEVDYTQAAIFMKEESAKSAQWLQHALQGILKEDKTSAEVLPPPMTTASNTTEDIGSFIPSMTDYKATPFPSPAVTPSAPRTKSFMRLRKAAYAVRDGIRKLRKKH